MGAATVAIGLTLWYAFNVGYNVYNKETSNIFEYPLTIAVLSLGASLTTPRDSHDGHVQAHAARVRPF